MVRVVNGVVMVTSGSVWARLQHSINDQVA